MSLAVGQPAIDSDALYLLNAFRRPRFRSMRRWALDEVTIPTGPFEGRKLSIDRQPFVGHWFDAIDSGHWTEFVATGPSQTGKSLTCFVIPVCYYLLEMQETVIAAVPDKDMVRDKWERDIEPVIARTRYRDLLPTRGAGSKGGTFDSITLLNGASLRFLTGGGSDKRRAGYTARVICFTETDGFDERTSTSRESSKIEQILARSRAWDECDRRIFQECTLSTETGHTWVRYQQGTASEIQTCCPHCKRYVVLERADFRGYQDAVSESDASGNSAFYCSACQKRWSEADRVAANRSSVLVHRGQVVKNGRARGPLPLTSTLGFRWSAVNNLLISAANIGADEYRAKSAIDEDDAERKMCQFVWATPYSPINEDKVELSLTTLQKRRNGLGKGQAPDDHTLITVGVDVNMFDLHWTAIAWDAEERGYVIDYGTHHVHARSRTFDVAIANALSELHDVLGTGWNVEGPDWVAVDCRWQTDEVVAAVKSLKDRRWRTFMGLGAGHWARSRQIPEKHSKTTTWIGNQAYDRIVEKHKLIMLYADANYWKSWLHKRLAVDLNQETSAEVKSITLYDTTDANPHATFLRHITAERELMKFEPGRGWSKTWDPIRKANHYLDSTYIPCVLRDRYGERKHAKRSKGSPAASPKSAIVRLDERHRRY